MARKKARLRTLYTARRGVILGGSEVLDVRPGSVVTCSDATHRAILPVALTGLATELMRLTFIEGAGDELDRAAKLITSAATAISPNHVAVLDAIAYLQIRTGALSRGAVSLSAPP